MKNTPYVKKYENNILINPITKENPYLQFAGKKGNSKFRKTSNTQGTPLLVIKTGVLSFDKFKKIFQLIKGKLIPHLQLSK